MPGWRCRWGLLAVADSEHLCDGCTHESDVDGDCTCQVTTSLAYSYPPGISVISFPHVRCCRTSRNASLFSCCLPACLAAYARGPFSSFCRTRRLPAVFDKEQVSLFIGAQQTVPSGCTRRCACSFVEQRDLLFRAVHVHGKPLGIRVAERVYGESRQTCAQRWGSRSCFLLLFF